MQYLNGIDLETKWAAAVSETGHIRQLIRARESGLVSA